MSMENSNRKYKPQEVETRMIDCKLEYFMYGDQ